MGAPISPDLLLKAYALGVFPMADDRDAPDVYWVEPKKRAILPLEAFHLSRSLRKTIRSERFETSYNRAFHQILLGIVDTFLNGHLYFLGFTKALPYYTLTVSYYNECREAEGTTTFRGFNYTVDGYHFFVEFNFTGLYSVCFCF